MDVKYQRLVDAWTTIKKLLSDDYHNFLPPATEDKILDFEAEIKTRLPADYRLSLAIHEGATNCLWSSIIISDISTVIKDWKSNLKSASDYWNIAETLEPYGPVRNDMFNEGWIPIAVDNEIPICIDMNPMPDGVVGQVIYVDWEDGKVKVIFNSFLEFLEEGVHKLESEQCDKLPPV